MSAKLEDYATFFEVLKQINDFQKGELLYGFIKNNLKAYSEKNTDCASSLFNDQANDEGLFVQILPICIC